MAAPATRETDSVQEHMLGLKMRLVQQKIQNEKDRLANRPSSEASTNNDLENQARLQQAMLRRQELLDKIRREQLLNEESKRPRSYSERRRYTPSPLPPPSRRSLPDLYTKYNMYNRGSETYRSRRPQDVSQVKHVIEHNIKPPPNLPPIHQPRAPPVVVHQQPPPQIIPMQQQAPQIIAAPAPQHIITGYPPGPVIHNLGQQPEKKSGMFNKEEFGDALLMQNLQMHQMVMQKMMIGNMGRQDNYDRHGGGGCHDNCHDCHSGCCSSHGVHGSCGHGHGHGGCGGHGYGGGCYDGCYPAAPRVNGAVHHHHYSSPPSQPQPAPVTYTTMPAMEVRGGYPGYRDYSSAYTGPGYTYAAYDEGDNYYTYH